ncbi:hypothetical protein ABS71_09850 [bacterium SCN 62-11]|nr:MAG: hypothetical protein ABS71_09850 [bacterium SCN 62-11]
MLLRLCVLLLTFSIAFAEPGLLVAEGGKVHQFDSQHRWQRAFSYGNEAKSRGLCASLQRVYVSVGDEVVAMDLLSGQVLWRTQLDAEPADRLDLSEDGRLLFVPSGFARASGSLLVLRADTGELIHTYTDGVPGRAHNCLTLADTVYLTGRAGRSLCMLDPNTGQVKKQVGPFSGFLRPFCIAGGRAFVNVDGLLGFEVGDLESGKMLTSVTAKAAEVTHPGHHECPSHGIGISPDGREICVVDSQGDRLLFFSSQAPYAPTASVAVGYDPGWVNYSLDGRYLYPSTGEVLDAHSKARVGWLVDKRGRLLQSEKILPIDWQDGRALEIRKQFALPKP